MADVHSFVSSPTRSRLVHTDVTRRDSFHLPARLSAHAQDFYRVIHSNSGVSVVHAVTSDAISAVLGISRSAFLTDRFSAPTLATFSRRHYITHSRHSRPTSCLIKLVYFVFRLICPTDHTLTHGRNSVRHLLSTPFNVAQPFASPTARTA